MGKIKKSCITVFPKRITLYNLKYKKFKKINNYTIPLVPPKLERSINMNLQDLPKTFLFTEQTYRLKLIKCKNIPTRTGNKSMSGNKELIIINSKKNILKKECAKKNIILEKIRFFSFNQKELYLNDGIIFNIKQYLNCFSEYTNEVNNYKNLSETIKKNNNLVPVYKIQIMKNINNNITWDDTYMLLTFFNELYYLNYKHEYNPTKYTKYTDSLFIKFF